VHACRSCLLVGAQPLKAPVIAAWRGCAAVLFLRGACGMLICSVEKPCFSVAAVAQAVQAEREEAARALAQEALRRKEEEAAARRCACMPTLMRSPC
jgi:hypothetical protein